VGHHASDGVAWSISSVSINVGPSSRVKPRHRSVIQPARHSVIGQAQRLLLCLSIDAVVSGGGRGAVLSRLSNGTGMDTPALSQIAGHQYTPFGGGGASQPAASTAVTSSKDG